MKAFGSGTRPGPSRRSAIIGAAAAVVSAAGFAGRGFASPSDQDFSSLWPRSGPPVLRGAVIAQRLRVPSIDGETFAGGRAVMPVYTRADFDALAEAGANLVVMSFPGVWSVEPPYGPSSEAFDQLDEQIRLAEAAGLHHVVGFRSGPGRSDFVFHRDAAGDWFPAQLIVDRIWRDAAAQSAWTEMCVQAAKRLAGSAKSAGLLLMVEPDTNMAGLDRNKRTLDAWSPSRYRRRVARISDWRRIAAAIAIRVRAAAPALPVLISPPAFARPDFLEVMGPPPVEGCVWCVHDYEPRAFTHSSEGSPVAWRDAAPPGEDGFAERLAQAQTYDAPVFLGEFGAPRWAPGLGSYFRARIAACEAAGVNWAAFRWPTHDPGYEATDNVFALKASNAALKAGWARNARNGRR
ncbi:MAG: cellulase family glycosylhydrolase [Hyphomonadaceae bacterium]